MSTKQLRKAESTVRCARKREDRIVTKMLQSGTGRAVLAAATIAVAVFAAIALADGLWRIEKAD